MRLTRSERYGPNEIKETSRRGPLRIYVSQFADFIVAAVAEGVGYLTISENSSKTP
jgi:hypothetical protein